jgi:hypothetical protein
MKRLTFILTIFLFLTNVLSSCGNKEKNFSENDIEFRNYQIDTTYHLFGDTTKAAIEINLEMDYPIQYKDNKTLTFIQQFVLKSVIPGTSAVQGDPMVNMRDFVQLKITEYKSNEESFKYGRLPADSDSSPTFEYQYLTKEETVFNKENIFCFSSTNYGFTGGAHGLQTIQYTCANLEKNEVITLEDLFTDDYENVLTPIILEKLAENNDLKSPNDLESNGFFDITEIKPNNNFYIDEKGITFVYNPYDIAAYVMGTSNVFIPYGDITFIIAPDSPIRRFL